MGEIRCTPWRRYGHDRVYVQRGDERLGYLDRATGALHADDAVRAEVAAALVAARWLEPPPVPAAPAIEWAVTLPGDTATYRPGQGAREMAQAAREAAPVKTALARLLRVHTDERAWRIGAEGEEAVAKRLAALPPGWTVVHDLPIGGNGANIDHLVVGQGGVFTLNTKNLGGTVWVGGDTFLQNGQRHPYVRNSRHEAARVGKVLSRATGLLVAAHGVVVVIADALTVKEQPRDVTVVVGRRDLVRWLRHRPPVLDAAAAVRVTRAVRDPRTWTAG